MKGNPISIFRTLDLLFICTFVPQTILHSQNDDPPTAIWVLPGISLQNDKNFKILGQAGRNSLQGIDAIYIQSFIKAGKHITLNPAYLFLDFSTPGLRPTHEHTLLNSVIISFNMKSMTLEDRNMIWNRFRKDREDAHYYRNRFRIIQPLKWKSCEIRLYIYNEAWFFLNDFRWTRNRLSGGIAYDLVKWFTLDISFVRQHDNSSGKMTLVFLMGTFQLFYK